MGWHESYKNRERRLNGAAQNVNLQIEGARLQTPRAFVKRVIRRACIFAGPYGADVCATSHAKNFVT